MAFIFRQGRQHGRLRQRGQTIADAQGHVFRPKPGHQTQRHIAVQGTAFRQGQIRIPPLEEAPHAPQLVAAPLQGVPIRLLSQGFPQGQDLIPQQHRRDGRSMQDDTRHPAQFQQRRSIQKSQAARLLGVIPKGDRYGRPAFSSVRPVPVDIKVIAATNVDLRQAVARGRFREDLYYRLNVAELTLPPLRERGDDILLLARHLLAQHAHNMERAALTLAPATQQCLLAYDWPGNVRELSNEMERAAALTVDTVIRPSDLSPKLLAALARHGCIKTSATAPREPLPDIRTTFNLEQAERLLVQRALDACQGNKSRAAELLGITREGLRKKLLRLDKTAHGHDGEEA